MRQCVVLTKMPRVKIEHIISFSSEDPEYPASALLEGGAGGRGWRCSRSAATAGQPGSLGLQLSRPARVATITAGALRAATIEVLVGRAESPSQWEVLVPTCVLLSPGESRRLSAVESSDGARVRSWCGPALAAAGQHRWDRLRVVLTQPYNKHVQFGLSFIHISEPEPAVSPSMVPLGLELQSGSDEEEFRPGELFAAQQDNKETVTTTTGAQIRKATSQVLKNIDDSASKLNRSLVKRPTTVTTEAAAKDSSKSNSERGRPDNNSHIMSESKHHTRDNDNLDKMHNDHERGDNLCVRSDTDHKRKEVQTTATATAHTHNHKPHNPHNPHNPHKPHNKHPTDPVLLALPERKPARANGQRSRERSKGESSTSTSTSDGSILRGVVCVLSGYQGTERARLRGIAGALGGKVRADWGPRCTHLICAFPNTPKLRAALALASRGGEGTPVRAATGRWLESCQAAGRRLPWRWFATQPELRTTPQDRRSSSSSSSEEADTDDEIERVVLGAPDAADDPSAAVYRAATPPRRPGDGLAPLGPLELPGLPSLWAGRTFALSARLCRGTPPSLPPLLLRYITAYGGTFLQDGEVSVGVEPHYWLCDSEGDREDVAGTGSHGRGARVRADWVWRCHAAKRLLPAPSVPSAPSASGAPAPSIAPDTHTQ